MRFTLAVIVIVLAVSFSWQGHSQPAWDEIRSVDDVCVAYLDKVQYLFQNLNLDYPGLWQVKAAWSKGEIIEACRLLLEYFKTSKSTSFFSGEMGQATGKKSAAADSVMKDIFTFQLVAGKVPRLPDGRLKWDHAGPENDIEWAWALNRHYPVATLLQHYRETGDVSYLAYIDRFIKDWIISSWPYPAKRSSTAMWRGLEVSFRVKTWAQVFFGFVHTDIISPATKLLILCSLPDHAHYARNFHAQNNWLTMEMSGLATVAAYWPQYKGSLPWLGYTINAMTESMKGQVYPDGAQTELTSSYHHVALDNFVQLLRICNHAGVKMPEFYTRTIEDMWNYLAYTMRPDGYGLLNNDADLVNNRNRILRAAVEYNRNDWKFIATNGGEGVGPSTGPSVLFPWAGHLISRNGYGNNAHFSFFDIGPWGSGHQHNDKLHISITAFGRDFLVDGGRFAYRGEVATKFRKYAVGSESHNVLLIDGKAQAPGPKLAETALPEKFYRITDDFDYGYGEFDQFNNLEGTCRHERAMMYVRDRFWIVADRITSDRPRKIEALWHWHPECNRPLLQKGNLVVANGDKYLAIVPAANVKWKVDFIKGQEEPNIQGWYSRVYNHYEPNYTSVFSANIAPEQTFVWILNPSDVPSPAIKAKVISQAPDGVTVKVNIPGVGSCTAFIPFGNAGDARMSFKSSEFNNNAKIPYK